MIQSFMDLVNESENFNQDGLVDEMGVKKPERLTGSEMGRIRQSSIDRAAQLRNQPARRSFIEVSGELINALKTIPRIEITMEKAQGERRYYPKFPAPIVALMQEAQSIDSSRFRNEFGRWRDVYPTESDAIYFKTESPSDFQRSHFPNGGIPPSLRGIGLGYKLYRTLLKYAGYISSNRSGTDEKDKAWGSLLAQKTNPDGSLSVDDAHAIIGSSNWMAIDKQTLDARKKITTATDFIERQLGVQRTQPNRFDMDDELIEILPNEFLTKLDQAYLDSLVADSRISQERYNEIEAAKSEVQRREAERMRREAEEARERQARQEAETRRLLADRIAKFGADPDADWNVGDYVVIKNYLYDSGYSQLPIRKVVSQSGNIFVAVKIADAIRIDNGEITPNQVQDNRTTTDKTQWIKVNIEQIPDLTQVNLGMAEIQYIESQLDPETQARINAEREEANRERIQREREANSARAQQDDTFGVDPENAREFTTLVANRNDLPNFDLLKKLRADSFYNALDCIVLDSRQQARLASPGGFGIPTWIAWTGSSRAYRPVSLNQLLSDTNGINLTNMITGHTIRGPLTGLGFSAYPISEVTVEDKLRARAGSAYYIAGHKNAFGMLAQSDYGAVNTSAQKFIYVKAYGWGQRSVSVRLDLLKKIGAPQEIV